MPNQKSKEDQTIGSYTALKQCRVRRSRTQVPVLDLDDRALTAVFPRDLAASVTAGPLRQALGCDDRGTGWYYRSKSRQIRGLHTGHGDPVISEKETRVMQLLVLPWHFKEGIVQREAVFLAGGDQMIFPFPGIEIILSNAVYKSIHCFVFMRI
jgi:hypothetical protein